MVRKLYCVLWRGARAKWYYDPGCCTSTRRKGSSGLASQQPSADPSGPWTGSVVVRQKSGFPARIFLPVSGSLQLRILVQFTARFTVGELVNGIQHARSSPERLGH